MFGLTPKRRGLFGDPADRYGPTPGTIEERPTAQDAGVPGLGMQAPTQKRKGLFGTGIQLGDVLGIAGDAVAINRGMTPMFAQSQQQERLLKQKQMLEEAGRNGEFQDFVRRETWKRDNAPEGDNVDLREDNAGNMWRFDKRTGQPIGDKPVWVDTTPKEFVADGMRFSIPNRYAQGASAAPSGDIPKVTDEAGYNALPAGARFYDDEGHLRTKSGGAASNGSGNFPAGY